jgi:hypothetical protein
MVALDGNLTVKGTVGEIDVLVSQGQKIPFNCDIIQSVVSLRIKDW